MTELRGFLNLNQSVLLSNNRQRGLLIPGLLAASGISLLGALVFLMLRGFDITDEAFSLLWIRHPWEYSASLSQFGFVYHPLFQAVGQSIAGLRIVNAALLIAGAFWLGMAVFSQKGGGDKAIPLNASVILTILSGSILIMLFAPFLEMRFTPSYNTLALQGILLATTGAFRKSHHPKSSLLCIALGGGVDVSG